MGQDHYNVDGIGPVGYHRAELSQTGRQSNLADLITGRGMNLRSVARMFVALLLLACDDRTSSPPPPKTVAPQASPPATAQPALVTSAIPPEERDSAPPAPSCPGSTGATGDNGDPLWSAVGQAPKGADVSLARQVASDRARKKLAEMLKNQRILDGSGELPAGATVERIWSRGKSVFAEVRWCNTSGADGLNEPPKRPSNSVEVGNPLKKPD
jgi:hypothetical protein